MTFFGRVGLRCLLVVSLLLCALPASAELLVLSYHEASHGVGRDSNFKAMQLETSELAAQFSWLREHGYVSVDIDDLLAAQQGVRPLPEKAVLLTFDDGYTGMYEQVFPLLRAFDYRAVLAVVGSWLETPADRDVLYGTEPVSRRYFLSWAQIREMVQSGYVEVASHSYDLHHGVLANPQGNTQPAAVSLTYDPQAARYESDARYRQRIRRDLQRNSDLIARRIGQRPRVMVWPYGAYSGVTIDIARSVGMPITMSLEDDPVDLDRLDSIGRLLIGHGTNLADFVWQVNNHIRPQPDPLRVVHVDIDYIYDPDPQQQDRNLGRLLDRVKALGVNTVYLQAYADPDGDGNADALYFPNRHLPMRADLFNRVSWQLRTRVGVKVYAWLPVLAYDLLDDHPLAKARVIADPPRKPGTEDYRRLSPFHPQVQQFVGDIYEDLARHAPLDGLIFHDDAYLGDHEDASEWARDVYRNNWKLPSSVAAIRSDPQAMQAWTERKSVALAQFTDGLAERARAYRPVLKTARNMYAAVIMDPQAETWFAQSLPVFLQHYDYTAVMAMPYMEKARHPRAWLRELVARVAKTPGALEKTVFELQSIDWRKGESVDGAELGAQMRVLLHSGARHFGYYPDDFIQGLPAIDAVRPYIALTPAEGEE